jgi:hypothetical protein
VSSWLAGNAISGGSGRCSPLSWRLAGLLALDGRAARMLAGGKLSCPRPEPRCPREPAVAPLHHDGGALPPSQSLLPSSWSRKGERGAGKETHT